VTGGEDGARSRRPLPVGGGKRRAGHHPLPPGYGAQMTAAVHPQPDATFHRAVIAQAVRLIIDQADMDLPVNRRRVKAGRWLLARLDGIPTAAPAAHHRDTIAEWVDHLAGEARRPQITEGPRSRPGLIRQRIDALRWGLTTIEA